MTWTIVLRQQVLTSHEFLSTGVQFAIVVIQGRRPLILMTKGNAMVNHRIICGILATCFWGCSEVAQAGAVVTLVDGRILKADTAEFSENGQSLILEATRDGLVIRRTLNRSTVVKLELDDVPSPGQVAVSSAAVIEPAADSIRPQTGPSIDPRQFQPGIEQVLWMENRMLIQQPGYLVGSPQAPQSIKQFAGWPSAGVVVGVRQDPLEAYGQQAARWYPQGIPQLEAGYARQLLRNDAAYQVAPPWAFNSWNNQQGTTNPGYLPPDRRFSPPYLP